jgi:uncharacterized protein YutE (UPF0331/DUF86 family)
MKHNGVVQRKFALLDKYLLQLQRELKGVGFEVFRKDWVRQRMTERALQVMVEIVIDIAERIIAVQNAGPAASATEAIEKLVELDVLKSAKPYINMVRFRNLIVHQYEEIDPEILYNLARNQLEDFRQFRNEIDRL